MSDVILLFSFLTNTTNEQFNVKSFISLEISKEITRISVLVVDFISMSLSPYFSSERNSLFSPSPGTPVMNSKTAAIFGITQVVFSRIVMATPGMTILPVVMERLEKKAWMQRIKPLHGPIQVGRA